MPRRPVASRWLMAAAAVTAVVLSVGILRNLAVSRNAGHVLRAGWVDHKECVLGGHLPAKPPSRDQAERRLAAHAGLLGIVEAAMPDYELRQAHECTVEGRRYTHIAMERAGDVVSVSLVRKNSGESLASPQSATIQGVAVYGFDSGEYLGFVMGSNAGGDLPRLAERLTPRIQKVLQTL